MWHNVEQNTEEWFRLRVGVITSSNFAAIMAHDCKKWGEVAIAYAERMALERITGVRDESSQFKNANMDRGHEYEPFAISAYEADTFNKVTNGGFYLSECGRFGDSPDGLISNNGCIEVKSVITKTQWKRIKSGDVDSTYRWQVNGHLLIGEKEWCDQVSFCPEMPENKRLIKHRIYRDEFELVKLQSRLNQFDELILEHMEMLK